MLYYVIEFDGCGIDAPLRAPSADAALALAKEAEKHGCKNVIVKVPAGDVLPLPEFEARYCGPVVESDDA